MCFLLYLFPWKETLTDAGEGDEGGTNHTKSHKITKHNLKNFFFYRCFPQKGTLTDAGDGSKTVHFLIYSILYYLFCIFVYFVYYIFCKYYIFCIFVYFPSVALATLYPSEGCFSDVI